MAVPVVPQLLAELVEATLATAGMEAELPAAAPAAP
jgi:hypothetical protein